MIWVPIQECHEAIVPVYILDVCIDIWHGIQAPHWDLIGAVHLRLAVKQVRSPVDDSPKWDKHDQNRKPTEHDIGKDSAARVCLKEHLVNHEVRDEERVHHTG